MRIQMNLKGLVTLAVSGLLVALPAGAAKLSRADARRVDSVFAPWNSSDSPGCAVSIARGGQNVFARGYGMAHLEQPSKITPETIFEAGSVSKQFVAAAVVLLAADAKLSFDDDVRTYLPEVPDFGVPITIRQMLNHTSGLRTFRALVALQGRPDGRAAHDNSEILALIARQQDLNFLPGEEYLYSNSGYILAALIVERVSGQSLQDFTDARLFEPLGMSHTEWRDDFTEVIAGRATAYETGPGDVRHTNMSNTDVHGNGGLLTTVGDLERWNSELDLGTVLGKDLSLALETQGRLNNGTVNAYALGLIMGQYRGMRQVAHSGGTAGYRAYLARYPEDDRLSIALLCNDGDINPTRLAHQVVDAVLGPAMTPTLAPSAPGPGSTKPSRDATDFTRWAGTYRSLDDHSVIRVGANDDGLVLGAVAARASADNRFELEGPPFEVAFSESSSGPEGQSARFMDLGLEEERRFVHMEEPTPSLAELTEYTGLFSSNELDVSYSITVEGGRLLFDAPFRPPQELSPLWSDTFELEDVVNARFPRRLRQQITVPWVVHFERDGTGRVKALFINEGSRIRRLRFDRR